MSDTAMQRHQQNQAEYRYRYEERLAILTDGAKPTPEQIALAMEEAAEAYEWFNEQPAAPSQSSSQ